MSNNYKIQSILFTILLLVCFSCESLTDSNNENGDELPEYNYSNEDSTEAYEMSIFWDVAHSPSDSTYEELLFNMYYLRETWRDSLPWLDSRRFLAPWVQKMLLVGVNDSTLTKIENGVYSGFDSLPTNLQPDSIKISYNLLVLYFDNYIHPILLSHSIEVLPGIIYAEPNHIIFIDWVTYPILFGEIDGEFAFIYSANGAINNRHLFKYVNGEPLYYGLINYDSDIDSTILKEIQLINEQWSDKSGW